MRESWILTGAIALIPSLKGGATGWKQFAFEKPEEHSGEHLVCNLICKLLVLCLVGCETTL